MVIRHTDAVERDGVGNPTLRQEQPQPTMTGTSSEASVSGTSVWQLAFLPSAEACCGATPTE